MYENVRTILTGHTSPETAYLVSDYPYGRTVRCRIRYWIESDQKRGFRFCSQTEDPRTLRWNNPKKGTYTLGAMVMYLDEKGHVTHAVCGPNSEPDAALAFVRAFGSVTEMIREVRVLANAHYTHSVRAAEGKRKFTINGEVQEPSEADIQRYTKEANAWREVATAARDAGLSTPALEGEKGEVSP